MTRLQKMVDVLDSIENKFNLDVMDLRILSKAQTYWNEGRELRVTDLVRVFSIASPATMHYRISKDLVKVGMFKLRPNPNDMREKLVEKGRRYEELHNFVEGL
jgi:Ran GTPase-activating protein (RanGAP) involved in mRNA processing and transport